MPFVREKVKTFHTFGLSTLQEIYTEEKLSQSLRLSANTLDTGILVNQSQDSEAASTRKDVLSIPQFRFQPLPRMAQISPSFGVSVGDFNADGNADLFLAQNFFSPQFETGRMDSGLSLILTGQGMDEQGNLQFHAVWPRESGILISGDAKACSLVDFNEDGWSDLLVTLNNGPIQAFEAQPHQTNRLFRVKLLGKPGNLDCVGAKVTLQFGDISSSQTAEVAAGGGYLSQASTILSFGCRTAQPTNVRVRWPDGQTSNHDVKAGQSALAIRSP
jgi:hypothetical protein